MRKIGFFINKNNCYVYGIDSHGATKDKPTLIFKNGDEYYFTGHGHGSNFVYEKNSIEPINRQKIKSIMSSEKLEEELILALKRFGFHAVLYSE